MSRFRIAPLARADLDEIHDYIACDKPTAAARWLDGVQRKFALLAVNPSIGQAREELRPNLRSISHGNYVIYYREIQQGPILEIARVIHSARDIAQITF